MIRIYLTLLASVVLTTSAWCGTLNLLSNQVYNGEVAKLSWQGEPLSVGVVRFMDRIIYLYPDPEGAVALLPVNLDTPAGDYSLIVTVLDQQGQTSTAELMLQVDYKDRPVEHLTLPERMVTPVEKDVARINRESKLLNGLIDQRSPRLWKTFEKPVDDPVNSVFGKRRVINGKPKSPHSGTDFRSPSGTRVRSISEGRVVLVADLFYTGKTVVVDHGEGLISIYAHLSRTLVDEEDELELGDVLGEVGSTGRSTGAHLHLTVRLLGERVDPIALLNLFTDHPAP